MVNERKMKAGFRMESETNQLYTGDKKRMCCGKVDSVARGSLEVE